MDKVILAAPKVYTAQAPAQFAAGGLLDKIIDAIRDAQKRGEQTLALSEECSDNGVYTRKKFDYGEKELKSLVKAGYTVSRVERRAYRGTGPHGHHETLVLDTVSW